MSTLLQQDAAQRPSLFYFNGPIPPARLEGWLKQRNLVVPNDLKHIWLETGGGDIFESETILGPYGNQQSADDVDSVNEFHWLKGMPTDWLLFHIGFVQTAINTSTGEYACLGKGSYSVTTTFRSLAEWYLMIRAEFAERYGLM